MDYVIQLIAATFGSLGFGMIFNIRPKNLLYGSLGGLLTWSVYLAFFHLAGANILVSALASAAAGQIYAEILARKRKSPVTVFSIPAVVPLIPGSALYRTMYAVVQGDWSSIRSYGLDTLQMTFGIAFGTSFIAACVYIAKRFHSKQSKKNNES